MPWAELWRRFILCRIAMCPFRISFLRQRNAIATTVSMRDSINVSVKIADLTFRYSFGDRNLFEPFTGPTFALVPGFGDTVKRRSQNVMGALTHVLTPNLVNETRVA